MSDKRYREVIRRRKKNTTKSKTSRENKEKVEISITTRRENSKERINKEYECRRNKVV